MIEFPFPDDIGPATDTKPDKYALFSDAYEKDPLNVFHGTDWESFENIRHNGFQRVGELFSTSFAFQSQYALEHACKKKRTPENPGVVIVVKFKPEHRVAKERGGDWHLCDHANSQPEILGFCRIPNTYDHR